MNKKFLNSRYYQLIAFVVILMLALCIRLFVLTIIQQDKWEASAESQNTKEVVTSAPRGEILDRYGRLLAGNKQIFTVTFNVSGMDTEEINNSCYSLVQLLEGNGDEYVDNFPIKITKSGKFYYTYDRNKRDWLESLGLGEDATAEDALKVLRKKYDISAKLDRFEAVEELQEKYSVWPPINTKSMTFTYDTKKASFIEKYDLSVTEKDESGKTVKRTDLNAKEAFMALRDKYSIDPELSNKEARKIFVVREEIKNTGYNKYRSSTIASDVCDETVAYIEEMGDVLKGVEIASETVRYYPNGNTLSHVLGYMGSISDSQYEEYVTEKGYSSDDLIGKDGIEASMESELRGTDGIKSILVNSAGDYVDTISETEPVAGNDVYLTIDLDLQEYAESCLEKCIKAVQTGSVYKSKYGNRKLMQYSNCGSGAVVAIDVETSQVLAMASYPDYDPNIFAEGISTKDWQSVQSTNPRDSLAPTPLYNIATSSAVQPGSTFKPITAVTALKCGLNPNRQIYDGNYIELGGRKFGCSNYNNGYGSHGSESLVVGIQNSCNYYFYCIGTGKDWNNGASLGYTTDISIEKIMEVAQEFGLGEETGVELYEVTTPLASKERKISSMKTSLWNALYYSGNKYWPKSTTKDDDKFREEIDTIVSWMEENPDRGEIITRLKEQTTVKSSKIETLADTCKYSYFNQSEWGTGDAFNISIGQGDNAYTPLQMARYIATLGNEGVRNQVSVVKGIENSGTTKKEDSYEIDVDKDDLKTVIEGMKLVVKRGTLAYTFSGFPIEVAGKTGTAQRDGYINPKNEVKYVKNHLSSIAPDITWSQVKKEMKRLMKKDPVTYPTENDAVDQALINVSDRKVSQSDINRYKDTYDNFAWTVAMAPADNPKIAVVALLVQGGYSSNAAPIARDVIGKYLQVDAETGDFELSNSMN